MNGYTSLVASLIYCFAAIMGLSAQPVHADGPTMQLKDISANDDSTITIHRGDKHRPLDPDYEINTGTEEVSGDPVSGLKESYDSWRKSCADWKKEMREMNGPALISLSCGTPHPIKDVASRTTQTSLGTYKLRVRIREAR